MGEAILIYVSYRRTALSCLRLSQSSAGSEGHQKERAWGYSHPRQNGCVDALTKGGDGQARPAVVPLPSLTPPNLIDALNVLEPLSCHTRYLLESTDTIIPTLHMPFISSHFLHQATKNLEWSNIHQGALLSASKEWEADTASTILPDPLQQPLPNLATSFQTRLFFYVSNLTANAKIMTFILPFQGRGWSFHVCY